MANATYDTLWQQAMAELGEQLHVEGVDEGDGSFTGEESRQVTFRIYLTLEFGELIASFLFCNRIHKTL